MAVKTVMTLVGADHGHRVFDLGQQAGHFGAVMAAAGGQAVGRNLGCRGIHRQMQLAPQAAFSLAMLAHPPLPLAKKLEPAKSDRGESMARCTGPSRAPRGKGGTTRSCARRDRVA